MGNFASCTLSTPPSKNPNSSILVILPKTREIKHFNQPIKAAEIMLESPNSFVVNFLSLSHGRRFSALNADEDLERGNVYVVFPMKRVNSAVTAADMGALFLMAKRVDGVRVLLGPMAEVEVEEEEALVAAKLNFDYVEDFSVIEFKHRLSVCRSKKPLLETIAEEPFYLRR